MPPRGVKSAKRKRQYEHIKESEQERGVGIKRAKEIAARTVNKQRSEAGQTKAAKSTSSRKKSASSRKKSTSSRKKSTSSRKRTSNRTGRKR